MGIFPSKLGGDCRGGTRCESLGSSSHCPQGAPEPDRLNFFAPPRGGTDLMPLGRGAGAVSKPGIAFFFFFLFCYHPAFGQLLVWSSRGGFSASVHEFPLAAQTRWWGADFLCDVPAAAEMSAWCPGYRNECLPHQNHLECFNNTGRDPKVALLSWPRIKIGRQSSCPSVAFPWL